MPTSSMAAHEAILARASCADVFFFFDLDMIRVEDLAYDLLYSVRLPNGDTAVIVRLPYKSYDPHATGVIELKRYPNKLYDVIPVDDTRELLETAELIERLPLSVFYTPLMRPVRDRR